MSVISTWATELCIRILYHSLGGVFSDGVLDVGGSRMVPVSGGCLCGLRERKD